MKIGVFNIIIKSWKEITLVNGHKIWQIEWDLKRFLSKSLTYTNGEINDEHIRRRPEGLCSWEHPNDESISGDRKNREKNVQNGQQAVMEPQN